MASRILLSRTSCSRLAAALVCAGSLALGPLAPAQSQERGTQARRAQAVELTRRAARAFGRGRYAEAVALCQSALRQDPRYVRAYTWLGASQQKLGRLGEARAAFERVVALAPSSADAARARRGLREVSSLASGGGVGSNGWRLAWSVRAHASGARALAWRADGAVLASAGDRVVRWWSRAGRPLGQAGGYAEDVTSLAWAPRGDLLAAGSYDNQLNILRVSLSGGRIQANVERSLAGTSADVNALAWSGDGSLLAAGGADGAVRLWSTRSWSPVLTLREHAAGVSQVAFGAGGTLISSGLDASVRGWDVRMGRLRWQSATESPAMIGVSRDGRTLAVAVGSLLQWRSAASGSVLRTRTLDRASLAQAAFSPSGRLLATGSYTPRLRLWNSNGALAAQVGTGSSISRALAWSPDGRLLAAAGADGWVRVWQAP